MTVSLYVFPALLREFQRTTRSRNQDLGRARPTGASRRSAPAPPIAGLLTLPIDAPDLVTVPVAARRSCCSSRRRLTRWRASAGSSPHDLRGQHFVLFESGSNTRRVLDEFFLRENIDAADRDGDRERRDHQGAGRAPTSASRSSRSSRSPGSSRGISCSAPGSPARALIRRTGWVYAKANRVPRAVQEVLAAFERIKPKLKLSPSGARPKRPSGAAAAPESEP